MTHEPANPYPFLVDPQFAEAVAAFERGDLEHARMLAQRQLASGSKSGEMEHLLGVIDCRSGLIDSGVEWLKRSLALAPSNASCRVMLARALIDSGRPAEALDTAVRPSGRGIPELALWHARAEAATAAGDWGNAVEAWEALATGAEHEWRAWSGYAAALTKVGRWAEAANAFRRAAELNPGELSLRRALAAALGRSGQYDQSISEFARCLEAAPADSKLRISFARLLADLGRQEEANVELRKAAELAGGSPKFGMDVSALMNIARGSPGGPVDLEILGELANLFERSDQDLLRELIAAAEREGITPEQLGYPAAAAALREGQPDTAKRLLQGADPDLDPVRWHWLMSRIADALNDSDLAFAEAEAMNRSIADFDLWRERGAEQRRWVRRISAVLEGGATRSPETPLQERQDPVFLVGFPRSGTTLLDTFLMGHPETAVLEEVPLVAAVAARLGDIALLPRLSALELADARNAYLDALKLEVGPEFDGLVIDKYPLNMNAMPYVHAIFPGAKIIFAQRHPCDSVLSCFMQGFVLNNSMANFLDIRDSADFYDASMTAWTRSRDVLGLDVHTLVYERLVADAETELRPLIDFLGLEWRPELLDHRSTAKKRGVVSTPSYNQVTQPLSTLPSGRWRRYERQLAPVLPILLPWAERLGY